MMIHSIHKGRTVKVVTIANVSEATAASHSEAITLAMEATGETPSSLFGTSVTMVNDDDLGRMAVVNLYTD